MIAKGLINFLLGNPGAQPLPADPNPQSRILAQAALVQATAGSRVYLNKSPQAASPAQPTYPYAIVHKVRGLHPQALGGPVGVGAPSVAVVWYALDGQTANQLGDQVRQLLNGYRGRWGAFTVQGCFLEDEGDDYLPPAHVDEIGVHSTPWSFKIWHLEQV